MAAVSPEIDSLTQIPAAAISVAFARVKTHLVVRHNFLTILTHCRRPAADSFVLVIVKHILLIFAIVG